MTRKLRAQQHKYLAIQRELDARLTELAPGDQLPSERALAARFGCTTVTLRKALAGLEAAGRIRRVRGSGTFVSGTTTPAPDPQRRRIGMLIDAGADAYAHQVMRALAAEAEDQGIELRAAWCGAIGPAALPHAQRLAAEGCTALTVPWFPGDRTAAIRDLVAAAPLPVCLPALVPGLEDQCFERPELFGATLEPTVAALVTWLVGLGHRRIAFLGPDVADDLMLQRTLRACTAQAGRCDADGPVGLVGPGPEAMDRLAAKWQRHAGELAVVAYDDAHALRFVIAMRRLGLTAPTDYAIVGRNDTEESRLCDPPLTTVAHDFRFTAHWLLRNALALAAGTTDRCDRAVEYILLPRASCGGAGRADDDLIATMHTFGVRVAMPADAATARA